MISKARFDSLNMDNRIWWGVNGSNVPSIKRFLSEVKQGLVPQTLWTYDEVGHTQEAKKVCEESGPFVPSGIKAKSTRLIPPPPEIVIDFFAGLATTAQAVLETNIEDGGNRKVVCV